MNTYSPYQHITEKGGKQKSRFMRILAAVLVVVTVAASLLLALSYLAAYINPNSSAIFAFLGLAAPILFLVNISAMLYWIIRWRRWAFLPMAVVLVGISNLILLFRPTLSKEYPAEKERGSFTIVSHNVHGFLEPELNTPSMENTLSFLSAFEPDILCIQEYQTTHQMPQEDAAELLRRMPNNAICYKLKNADGGFGLAIYSRYPIIHYESIDFEESVSQVMWADILYGRRDTIRVFNCHLQTTSIDATDKEFISSAEFMRDDKGQSRQKARSIASKLRRNFKARALQADSIAPLIAASPYKVIVCGDFNDTPLSYTYHKIRGGLGDSFVEKGRGMTNTYQGFFNLFRIDYVLHSPSLKTLYYSNPRTRWSDHNAVVVNMKKR